jgi:glycosyltransferase involved in cell wall biosynthesis
MLRRSGIFRPPMHAHGHDRGAPDLCVVYTTKDSMRTIERSIRSVQPVARRVVVVDSGSTDGTQAACQALGAEVHHQPWLGYARQKQRAIDLAGDASWILLLDSDEIATPELVEAIRGVLSRGDAAVNGYWIARQYWYKGGPLRIAYPDRVVRLVRRGAARMRERAVHEVMEIEGRTERLPGVLRHESWVSVDDALQRNLAYARLAAQVPGKRSSMLKVVTNAPWAFVRAYLLQGGILDGRRGFEVSLVLATATAFKHLALIEAERDASARAGDR